jgi:hypothetical protein
MGIPWIGSSKGGNPAFISEREVSVIVDMAEGVLARWGRCCCYLGEYFLNFRELSRELNR